jgi:hypothetical protein
MSTFNILLIANTVVLGVVGLMFAAAGSNVQSRVLGIIQLLMAIANINYMVLS